MRAVLQPPTPLQEGGKKAPKGQPSPGRPASSTSAAWTQFRTEARKDVAWSVSGHEPLERETLDDIALLRVKAFVFVRT